MAIVPVTVYTAGHAAASGANYTDNKTAGTSADTYTIPNNGATGVILEATAGGTAIIATPGTVLGLAITDLTLTLTAAKILLWGGFDPTTFNDPATQKLSLTVAQNTNIFAFRLS